MSVGFSIGDAILLTQIASRTVQNSREACGAHDALTHEVSNLLLVLRRLKDETAKPESPINRPDDHRQEELQSLVTGCKKTLKTLENILVKYNSLSGEQRSGRKLWQRIKFGNGEMQDLAELRATLVYHTSAISLFLNMVSIGSIGRVERQMDEAGGDLRDIRIALNGITAHLLAGNNRESSVLTTYADDDKAVWKEFRRELVKEGFSSSIVRQYKGLIKAYITELASRGVLDEQDVPSVYEANAKKLNLGGDPLSESLVAATPTGEVVTESTHAEEQDRPDDGLVKDAEDLTVEPAFEWQEETEEPVPPNSDDQKVDLATSDVALAQSVELFCGHRISYTRVRRLFEMSMTDARYMPPRCCRSGEIVPDQVQNLFDVPFQVTWNRKFQESLKDLENPHQIFAEVLREGPYLPEYPCRIFFTGLIDYFRAKLLIITQGETENHVLCTRVFCGRGCQKVLAMPPESWFALNDIHKLTTRAYYIFKRMIHSKYPPTVGISEGIDKIVRAVQTCPTVMHTSDIVDILFSINDWVLYFEDNCVQGLFNLQQWIDIASLEWSANNECIQMAEPSHVGRSTAPKEKFNPSEESKHHPFTNLLAQIWTQNNGEDLLAFVESFRAAQQTSYCQYTSSTPIIQLTLLEKYYQDVMLPRCENFILDAPTNPTAREEKYRALGEWMIQDHLHKLNKLKLDGDESLRSRRKKRVQEAQETLRRLADAIRKK